MQCSEIGCRTPATLQEIDIVSALTGTHYYKENIIK